MAATETVKPSMPETVEAAELARARRNGEFGDCLIEGPLSFDLAYAADAGAKKRIEGSVVGAADIMLFPNLLSANLTVKAIMYTADCRFGGVLAGHERARRLHVARRYDRNPAQLACLDPAHPGPLSSIAHQTVQAGGRVRLGRRLRSDRSVRFRDGGRCGSSEGGLQGHATETCIATVHLGRSDGLLDYRRNGLAMATDSGGPRSRNHARPTRRRDAAPITCSTRRGSSSRRGARRSPRSRRPRTSRAARRSCGRSFSGRSATSPSERRSIRASSARSSATATASRRSSSRAGPIITSRPISTCPTAGGRFPGVLLPCGHSDNGKAYDDYQRASILLAKNGMAVLCYDPIGQGERFQMLDAKGKPVIRGTTEHTMAGIGALLVGRQLASYRIWDGLRALDYLASRPEVDPARLGCTGNSGGGTMTSYLMALDDRIGVAAPSCYITSLERLFATIGPQDAEQNITGQVAAGMDHADYVTMRAPKPTLLTVGTRDFFDIQGSWDTFREVKLIYGRLGFGERVDLFESDEEHGFTRPRRVATVRWMRRWLLKNDDAVVEPDFSDRSPTPSCNARTPARC